MLLAGAVLAAPQAALAYVPSGGDAARLPKQWRPEPSSTIQPRLTQPALPVIPALPADSAAQDTPLLILQQVTLAGIPTAQQAPYQEVWKTALGKNLSKRGLEAITDALLSTCRNQGYLFCTVAAAQADMDTGHLNVTLARGRLAGVEYDVANNSSHHRSPFLEEFRQKLLRFESIRVQDIEQSLLLLNTLPGLNAKGTLVRRDDGVHLVIRLEEVPHETILTGNNRGSHFIGPFQLSANTLFNGVFRPFDQIGLRLITGTDNQELLAGELSYKLPLNSRGTVLELSAFKTWSEPGFTLRPFELESVSRQLKIGVSHPLKRSLYENLSVLGGFALSDARTKSLGTPISTDRLRSLTLGLDYDLADRFGGTNLLNVEVSQGFTILDATESGASLLTRANGKSGYTAGEVFYSHQHPLTQTTGVRLSLSGQYALTQLLSSEEFGFGGSQFGRGYDASEITGDHGAAALLEFTYTPSWNKPNWLEGLQFYSSYDIGSVWRIDTNTRDRQLTGASAALGVRLNLKPNIALDIQAAKPLTRGNSTSSEDDAKNARVFGSVVIRF